MAKYTAKIGDQVCKLTITTAFGLRQICKELSLPYSTVSDWVYDREHEMYLKYKQAKIDQLTCLADEILELMNDTSNDYITVEKNGKNKQVQNRECLARTRLKINTTIMLITRLKPVMEKELLDLQRKKKYDAAYPPRASNTNMLSNTTLSFGEGRGEATSPSFAGGRKEILPPLSNTSLSFGEGRGEASSPSFAGGRKEISPPLSNTSLSFGEGRGEASSLPSQEGRYGALEAEKSYASAAPEKGLKPAPGKPVSSQGTHHLNNTSLSFGEGRGEASSLSFGEGRGEATSLPSQEGRYRALEAEQSYASAAPEKALKPAPGKPVSSQGTHHLSNTSLSFGEGRGEASSLGEDQAGATYTIHPHKWAKMNKRERRVAMLEYSSKIPPKMPYDPRRVKQEAEQLKKELKKTEEEKRREDKKDLEQQRIDKERNILPEYEWHPLPGGGFECKRLAPPRPPVSNYRWVTL